LIITLTNEFLDYIQVKRNFSAHTIRSYAADLMQFCQYLAAAGSGDPLQLGETATSLDKLPPLEEADVAAVEARILSVEPVEIRAYLGVLSENKYSRSTIARKLATLRSFYKYLVRTGRLESSPVSVIRTPRQDRRLPKFLDISQIDRLLDAPDKNTLLGARDSAILETIYSAGLRISELVGLNIEDMDENEGVLRIRGKGRKERLALLGSKAVDALRHYRRKRDAALGPTNQGAMFLNRDGTRISDRSIRRKLDKYMAIAGLPSHISPHTLRHTFATHMLNAGADLRCVQEMLGHENLSTTQIYTHLTTRQLRQVYDKAHPLMKS